MLRLSTNSPDSYCPLLWFLACLWRHVACLSKDSFSGRWSSQESDTHQSLSLCCSAGELQVSASPKLLSSVGRRVWGCWTLRRPQASQLPVSLSLTGQIQFSYIHIRLWTQTDLDSDWWIVTFSCWLTGIGFSLSRLILQHRLLCWGKQSCCRFQRMKKDEHFIKANFTVSEFAIKNQHS